MIHVNDFNVVNNENIPAINMYYIYLFDNNIALFTIMTRCAVLCNTVHRHICRYVSKQR